jgi:hypothetical protein
MSLSTSVDKKWKENERELSARTTTIVKKSSATVLLSSQLASAESSLETWPGSARIRSSIFLTISCPTNTANKNTEEDATM